MELEGIQTRVRMCKCALDTIEAGDNTVPAKSHECTLKPSASTRHLELGHSFVVLIKHRVVGEISVI